MEIYKHKLLNLVRFSHLTKWSVYSPTFESKNPKYPIVTLSKVLKRYKEPISVKDNEVYKRITVRLYGQGVLQRDQLLGKDIGTKRQFVAHTGQLIISRIDARNGAFGIIPKDLDGAIVTNDFWLFDVQNALPQYLMLVLSSVRFQQYWQTQSSGTTNRQRVDESSFLSAEIALPTQAIQLELLDKYNKTIAEANVSEDTAKAIENEIIYDLYTTLGIDMAETEQNATILSTVLFKDIHQWGYDKIAISFPFLFKKYKAYSFSKKPFWLKEIFRGKSPKYLGNSDSIILNQKCNRFDEIDLAYAKKVDGTWLKSIDSKYFTREGDILINSTGEGTLGRASLISKNFSGLAYDSHMLLIRVNKEEVNPQLIVDLINSPFGQSQIEILKSAQATKQTELGIENAKKILFPLPNLDVQNKLVERLASKKKKEKDFKKKADILRQNAKMMFEEEALSKSAT